MGLFNFFKKKSAAQSSSTNSASNNLFQKEELRQLINSCDNIANMFANSAALRATENGRSEKMRQTMLSYKNIFVYFYDEICGYGKTDAFLSVEETVTSLGVQQPFFIQTMSETPSRKLE